MIDIILLSILSLQINDTNAELPISVYIIPEEQTGVFTYYYYSDLRAKETQNKTITATINSFLHVKGLVEVPTEIHLTLQNSTHFKMYPYFKWKKVPGLPEDHMSTYFADQVESNIRMSESVQEGPRKPIAKNERQFETGNIVWLALGIGVPITLIAIYSKTRKHRR